MIAVAFYNSNIWATGKTHHLRAEFGTVIWMIILLACLAKLVQYQVERRLGRETDLRLPLIVGVCITLLFFQFATFFGTGNSWIKMNAWFCAGSVAALLVLVAKKGKLLNSASFYFTLPTIFLIFAATQSNFEGKPYGLVEALENQSHKVAIRGGRSELFVDKGTKEALDQFSQAAEQMGVMGERPVLIDISGRLPLAIYHMGARPLFSPWVVFGQKGSQELFNYSVSKLSREQFERTWLLMAPNYKRSFLPQGIEARGKSIERDYREVARFFVPTIKGEAVLLAPRSLDQGEK
jgi:hypothetical protein